jgi:hypothetical protein
MQPVENEVDGLKFQVKDAIMIQAKNRPRPYWLTLVE